MFNLWRQATRRYRVLPDFLIIGAQRSGTSTLYQHIARHPNVRRAARKEVHFFDTHYDLGLDWYRAQFPRRGSFVTGEASPSYMFLPFVPARVAEILPAVKLIAILRNPIDRALSSYHHQRRKQREPRTFAEAVKAEGYRTWAEVAAQPVTPKLLHHSYLARGLYADQLQLWPRDQLLVLCAEAFFKETTSALNRVFNFLGLLAWSGDPSVQRWVSEKYSYDRYADMDDGLRRELIEYYRPHNERLYRLVGEDFGWSG